MRIKAIVLIKKLNALTSLLKFHNDFDNTDVNHCNIALHEAYKGGSQDDFEKNLEKFKCKPSEKDKKILLLIIYIKNCIENKNDANFNIFDSDIEFDDKKYEDIINETKDLKDDAKALHKAFLSLLELRENEHSFIKACRNTDIDKIESGFTKYVSYFCKDTLTAEAVKKITNGINELKKLKTLKNIFNVDLEKLFYYSRIPYEFLADTAAIVLSNDFSNYQRKVFPKFIAPTEIIQYRIADWDKSLSKSQFDKKNQNDNFDKQEYLEFKSMAANIILPIQRITRYPLTLQEIYNNVETVYKCENKYPLLDIKSAKIALLRAMRGAEIANSIQEEQFLKYHVKRLENYEITNILQIVGNTEKIQFEIIKKIILNLHWKVSGSGKKYTYNNSTYYVPTHIEEILKTIDCSSNDAWDITAKSVINICSKALKHKPSFLNLFYKRSEDTQFFYNALQTALEFRIHKDNALKN